MKLRGSACLLWGEWKIVPNRWASACTRSTESVSPPFGQRNCPEMDSCAQGRAYRKWNNTAFTTPSGSWDSLTWPSCSRHADRWRSKVFQKVSHIPHSFRVTRQASKRSIVLFDRAAPVNSQYLVCIWVPLTDSRKILAQNLTVCSFMIHTVCTWTSNVWQHSSRSPSACYNIASEGTGKGKKKQKRSSTQTIQEEIQPATEHVLFYNVYKLLYD